MEVLSPQKLPQAEFPAQVNKPEYVELKEDREAVKVSKFEAFRSPRNQLPKPKVIQVAKQEPLTRVIVQPKLEKFDYQFNSKKIDVVPKTEEKKSLAQRNIEAKVAHAMIELKEEPVAMVKEPVKEKTVALAKEPVKEKKIEQEAFTSVVEIEKPKITQRRKSTGFVSYERPKSTIVPI